MPRPRKDKMKPQAIDYGVKTRPEGGMAHSAVKEDTWGAKKPPFPRSVLNQTKETIRSGMALYKA